MRIQSIFRHLKYFSALKIVTVIMQMEGVA